MLLAVAVTLIVTAATSGQQDFFKEIPTDQSLKIGDEATLFCAAYQSFMNGAQFYSQWKSSDGVLLGDQSEGQLPGHNGRYYYISKAPYEKHLRIRNLSLDDDGLFECQMIRSIVEGPTTHHRAKATLTVLAAPDRIAFLEPYGSDQVIDVKEHQELNVTCAAYNAKPAAELNWLSNEMVVKDGVNKKEALNGNRTITSSATLLWAPKRSDQNRIFTCRSLYKPMNLQKDIRIRLNVIHPSEKPSVEVKDRVGSLKAGDNVTLSCKAKGGNPRPTLRWYLRDRLLVGQVFYDEEAEETVSDYSMVVGPEDNAAGYECRSSNSFSSEPVKTTLYLSVEYAALNVVITSSDTAIANRSVQFKCNSGLSNPLSTIEWLVNGHHANAGQSNNSSRTLGFVTESVLDVVAKEDNSDNHEMIVVCNARNEVGSIRKERRVKIMSAPRDPTIVYVNGSPLENETMSFKCSAAGGNPPANLSWWLGQDKLSNATTIIKGDTVQTVESVLIIRLNRSMHQQKLRCEAKNDAVNKPHVTTHDIKVYFPPQTVTVESGGNAYYFNAGQKSSLTCRVRFSNPVAEIGWDFPDLNDAVNSSKSRNSIHNGFEVDNTLEFLPSADMNGLQVGCHALSNRWARVNSSSFRLDVHYAPRVVNFREKIVVVEGSSFRTNFTIDANPSVSEYGWRKGGIAFFGGVGSIHTKGGNMASNSILTSDGGEYELSLANSYGTSNMSFRLIVEHAAQIINISDDKLANVGEKVTVWCVAIGIPKMSNMTQWRFDGKLVTDGVTTIDDGHKNLTFIASKNRSGTYTCIANNGVGKENEKDVRVLVQTEPSMYRDEQFRRAAGRIGGKSYLRCRARAVPAPEFYWSFSDSLRDIRESAQYSIKIDSSKYPDYESTLVVHKVEQFHYERLIKCRARNALGEDTIDVKLGPPSKPDTPRELERVNATKSSLLVSWKAGFDGGSKQRFQLRYRRIKEGEFNFLNASDMSAEITGLSPAEQYEVSVRAWNEDGHISSYSSPLKVYTRNIREEDVQMVMQKADSLSASMVILLGLGGIALFVVNSLLLCYMHRRQKRRKMQEKTEMVRKMPDGKGDSRTVQMYGALTNTENGCRPESVNTNRSELVYERASEDEQSMRTIIEVNPNGFVEDIGQNCYYDRDCIVEYDFDPSLYPDMVRPGSLRRPIGNYSSAPYPESLGEEMSLGASSTSYSPGIISRRSADAPLLGSPRRQRVPRGSESLRFPNLPVSNGNGALMSTFVRSQPGSLLTTPLTYANIDGDLV